MATLDHLFLMGLVLAVTIEVIILFAVVPTVALFATLAIAMAVALQLDPSTTVSGFRVSLGDVLFVALVGGSGVRVVMRKAARVAPTLVALGLLVVLAIARGASAFRLQPAVNEARELMYFVAAAVFFSTVPIVPKFISSFRQAWLYAGGLLVGMGVFRWTRTGFGTLAAHFVTGRALTSTSALLILEAALVSLVFPVGRGASRWIFPSVYLFVVVLSAQRTVWIAAGIGLAVLLASASRIGERRSSALIRTILLVVGAAFALVLAVGPAVVATLGGASGSSFSQGGTLAWRFAGWQQLVARQLRGPTENLLVGNPAGSGFARLINNQQVVVAAHSEYVTVFVSLGVFGLLLLVAFLVSLVKELQKRTRSLDDIDRHSALLLLALLAIEVVHFVSYSSGFSAGILLGVAVAFSRGARPGDVAPSAPHSVGVAKMSGAGDADRRQDDG